MLSKGVQTAYEDIKQKRVDKRQARQRQIALEMDLYGTYPIIQPDAIENPKRKNSLKKKLSRRWKSQGHQGRHEQLQHNGVNHLTFEHQLTHPDGDHRHLPRRMTRDMSLGISTEGRASAEARADRNRRRVQRMNDRYGLAVSMVRARRHMMEHSMRGGMSGYVEPPPAYDINEPRLPTYEQLGSDDPASTTSGHARHSFHSL